MTWLDNQGLKGSGPLARLSEIIGASNLEEGPVVLGPVQGRLAVARYYELAAKEPGISPDQAEVYIGYATFLLEPFVRRLETN